MNLAQPYNREDFVKFITDFLPDDFEEEIKTINYTHGLFQKVIRLGHCAETLNKIQCFEIIHTSASDARISLSREMFRYMKQNAIEYALVALVPADNPSVYRFSFISMSYKSGNGKIEVENSNPKRYSFLLGKDQHIRTPQDYLINRGKVKDINDLKERFSIEVLTKDFYNELFHWYEEAIKNFIPYPKNDEKKEEHIIRLITRLMFVWFIKQKKLIPDEIFDVEYLKTILKDFNPFDKTSSIYYNAILQNLFFATLNCEIEDRQFSSDSTGAFRGYNSDYNIKTKYRDNNGSSWFLKSHDEIKSLFASIPFLNGGLFECLTNVEDKNDPDDGFSRDKNKRSFLANNLFFDEENGIISILKKYNWTIEENSPADIEVALDPELLGKVFENLLGTYNPETRETARKDSGSFYTPRPIVQYMTDESLISYLSKKIDCNLDTIHRLITSLELPEDIQQNKQLCNDVINNLQKIKILDPACGSGAFPMGLLNRIVEIVTKIDPQINRYRLKLNLIENCIYGVDIQTIAIQISKLRCFISLICEQEANTNKNDNYGIHPLPNLETKFVAANTLVSLGKDITDEIRYPDKRLDELKQELLDIRVHKMINVASFKDKKALRIADKQLCDQVALLVSDRIGKPNEEYINVRLHRINELENEKKKYNDVKMKTIVQKIMGNLFDDMERQETLSFDENKKKREDIDRQISTIKREIDREKNKVRSSKTEQEIKKLVGWNPYKPTSSSEFFDAHWMFNLSDGFDIVIGNPPYVQLQKFKGKDIQTVYKNQNYQTYEATGDLYCLFYEKGIELLKDGGILCYITSNKWMRAGYGESLRSYFIKYNPTLLIDLGANVFTSATVDTNILLVEKKGYDKKTLSCTLRDRSQEMSVFVRQNAIAMEYTKDAWAILNPIEQSIKAKIEKYGTPLKDWDITINYGIKTGCNEAFIISGEKRKELIAEDPKSDEIIRPILRGRDIKRYGYEFADLWLIATFPSKHYDIDDYPAVKKWLQSFGKKLEQTGEEYIDSNGIKQKCRKKTNNKWFETQDSIAYWNDFSKQKIIYPNMTKYLPFIYDENGYMTNQKCFILLSNSNKTNLKYIVAFLNSNIAKKWIIDNCPELQGGTRELSKIFFEKIKIPHVSSKDADILARIVMQKLCNCSNVKEYNEVISQINEIVYTIYKLDTCEIQYINDYVEKRIG